MSSSSWFPCVSVRHSSWYLVTLLSILYGGGAVCCLWMGEVPMCIRWLGVGICLGVGYPVIQKYGCARHKDAILFGRAQKDGNWVLIHRGGHTTLASLLGSSWRSQWLIILNFRCHRTGKKFSLLLSRDSVENETLNQVQTYCRVC